MTPTASHSETRAECSTVSKRLSLSPALLFLAYLGCAATFAGKELPQIQPVRKPLVNPAPVLSYSLTVLDVVKNRPEYWDRGLLEKQARSVLSYAGHFPSESGADPGRGTHLVLDFRKENSSGLIKAMCMLSLTLLFVPVRNRFDISLRGSVFQEGRLIKQFDYKDHYSIWFHPFFWFIGDSPDYRVDTVAQSVYRNMILHFLNDAREYLPEIKLNPVYEASLVATVRRGDVTRVERLLRKGADPNATDAFGSLPLREAIYTGNMQVVRILVKAGAFVNAKDPQTGMTALHAALYARGTPELVTFLVRNGADVNARDLREETPLHGAVSRMALVRLLVESGADVHARDQDGRTPLFRASELGVVQFLIRHGARVDARDTDGRTPLHVAAGESESATSMFLESGAPIDARDSEGKTPLLVAAVHGRVAVVAQLLQKGANSAAVDEAGAGALHHAVRGNARAMIDFLLRRGFKIEEQDRTGRTPLFDAERREHYDTLRFLIERGANPNARDHRGRTALHHAAISNRVTMVRILLSNGGNPSLADHDGKKPQHYCRRDRRDWCAKAFEQPRCLAPLISPF